MLNIIIKIQNWTVKTPFFWHPVYEKRLAVWIMVIGIHFYNRFCGWFSEINPSIPYNITENVSIWITVYCIIPGSVYNVLFVYWEGWAGPASWDYLPPPQQGTCSHVLLSIVRMSSSLLRGREVRVPKVAACHPRSQTMTGNHPSQLADLESTEIKYIFDTLVSINYKN